MWFFMKESLLKTYLLHESRNTAEISGNWVSTCRQGVLVYEGSWRRSISQCFPAWKREALKQMGILTSGSAFMPSCDRLGQ